MNRTFAALVLSLMGWAGALVAQEQPVVVELYTSQGCSSCPPADDYFHKELANRDDVIALALHVDYWDYIGWKDSFANPAYTARQKNYARASGHRSVYTPQMIVNGKDHVVGTHPEKVEKLISRHSGQAGPVALDLSRQGNRIRIAATASRQQAMQVHVVRYKPEEKVSIKRGENAGRMVIYGNIVSDWKVAADWNGKAPLDMEMRVKGDAPVVVLIQGVDSGPILAAARLR
ncbi:hypothetical protein SAMN04488042_10462 [Shimia aestuarii]|uniref:DUF1223 domain-containing protein n=2 Tax=Shimia aestuarii TaxID=254406 RepID=A0A1I4N9H8_9RHOB|nr:hypothetical protein SAMN04488042_10462 [Shimia aestuarii]